jgi:hypothetical protein
MVNEHHRCHDCFIDYTPTSSEVRIVAFGPGRVTDPRTDSGGMSRIANLSTIL